MSKWIIYEHVPEDRSAVRTFYILEAKDLNGESVRRMGVSMQKLADDCRLRPLWQDGNGVMLATIAAPQVNLERGFRLMPVGVNDLSRFRRYYNGRG